MRYTEIEINGKAKRLRYNFNALADIEEKAGVGIGALLTENRIGFNVIRLLIWAGLKHENHGLTIQAVGNMLQGHIENGGDLKELVDGVTAALVAAGVLGNPEGKNQAEAAE